jgi:hypothetical protein
MSNANLWRKIPVDVFINHIAPYAYERLDEKLITDIRNFTYDYRMITNYYYFDMNEYCLLYDLICFCNNTSIFETVNTCFLNVLNRNITFRQLHLIKKHEYVKQHFYNINQLNISKKIKFLLGLLTPFERARFINRYIIEYYE